MRVKNFKNKSDSIPALLNIGCWGLLEPYNAIIESLLNCFFSVVGVGWLKKLSSSADLRLGVLSDTSSGLDGAWLGSCFGLELTGGALKKFENTSSALLLLVFIVFVGVGESAQWILEFSFEIYIYIYIHQNILL